MISKAKSKFIKSLQIKKYRKHEQCFVVEGRKSVEELLRSDFEVTTVVATTPFMAQLTATIPSGCEQYEVSAKELGALGGFQTNDSALAVARMKANTAPDLSQEGFALVLDDIRDPGNLGTIIRIADWYGIHQIIASEETADCYNPKVVSATMGSFARVPVYYTDLPVYCQDYTGTLFGTFLEGADVHTCTFGTRGLIVIGSESHGISPAVAAQITARITIPRYGQAESLNAGTATAVVLDNLARQRP